MNPKNFTKVQRNCGPALLHNKKPIWIVEYEAVKGIRPRVWCVYYATEKVLKGRVPWAADNRRIGNFDDHRTLKSAMVVAEEKAQEMA